MPPPPPIGKSAFVGNQTFANAVSRGFDSCQKQDLCSFLPQRKACDS